MKVFVIQTFGGYYTESRKFKSISFPFSVNSNLENATRFLIKGWAQWHIRNKKLKQFNLEIKEIEV
jgi:hypothetical protein